jgi:hypothetical protein
MPQSVYPCGTAVGVGFQGWGSVQLSARKTPYVDVFNQNMTTENHGISAAVQASTLLLTILRP